MFAFYIYTLPYPQQNQFSINKEEEETRSWLGNCQSVSQPPVAEGRQRIHVFLLKCAAASYAVILDVLPGKPGRLPEKAGIIWNASGEGPCSLLRVHPLGKSII